MEIVEPMPTSARISFGIVLPCRVVLKADEKNPAPVSYTHLDVYKRQVQKSDAHHPLSSLKTLA